MTDHARTDFVPREVRRTWARDGYYPDHDLYALFSRHRQDTPDNRAVIDEHGSATYAELDDQVRRLASGLARTGVRAGDVVGVQLSNSRLSCAVELAIAALGAIALPYPVGRGDHDAASLLERSAARAVVVTTDYGGFPCAERTRALADRLPELHTVVAVGEPVPAGCVPVSALLEADPTEFVPAERDPDGPARILVSSGSESEPKMVLYSHNALAGGRGRFMAELRRQARSLRNLFLVPLGSAFGSHAVSSTLAAHGGTLILRSQFEPAQVWDTIRNEQPTHVFGVPTMARMLLEHIERDRAHDTDLRALVVGGAPLDGNTAQRVNETLGCAVVNLYGSADGVSCHTDVDGVPDGTAGVPDPGVADLRIVDQELNELPAGEIGEILGRGPMTPMCYVASPELDARYRTAEGWVRSGDAGYRDDHGRLTVVGRHKDVIIRGGLNISPAQVENVLTTHPDIVDVACVPVPDQVLGERMCACVASQHDLALEDLTKHLIAEGLDPRKLPELALVLPRLPLGVAGKVDRQVLCQWAENHALSSA